jgi:hypothetical protein
MTGAIDMNYNGLGRVDYLAFTGVNCSIQRVVSADPHVELSGEFRTVRSTVPLDNPRRIIDKEYVDSVAASISGFLKLDGSSTMTGNINMNGYSVSRVGTIFFGTNLLALEAVTDPNVLTTWQPIVKKQQAMPLSPLELVDVDFLNYRVPRSTGLGFVGNGQVNIPLNTTYGLMSAPLSKDLKIEGQFKVSSNTGISISLFDTNNTLIDFSNFPSFQKEIQVSTVQSLLLPAPVGTTSLPLINLVNTIGAGSTCLVTGFILNNTSSGRGPVIKLRFEYSNQSADYIITEDILFTCDGISPVGMLNSIALNSTSGTLTGEIHLTEIK